MQLRGDEMKLDKNYVVIKKPNRNRRKMMLSRGELKIICELFGVEESDKDLAVLELIKKFFQ